MGFMVRKDIVCKYLGFPTNLFGTDADCYVENDEIFKLYKRFKSRKNMYDFSQFVSPMITFPKYYLLDENISDKVLGEVMPYIPKLAMYQVLNKDSSIERFIINYMNLLEEFKKFRQIQMVDLVAPNILYDDTGFTIIDTTDWKINSKDNYLYNKNMLDDAINEFLVCEVYNVYGIIDNKDSPLTCNLQKRGTNGQKLLALLRLSYENISHIMEIMELYQKLSYNEYGELKTLGDIGEYTKILKKH